MDMAPKLEYWLGATTIMSSQFVNHSASARTMKFFRRFA